MAWITLQHFPGFCDDLTKWTITVEANGSFAQRVELDRPIRRSVRYDCRVLEYQGKISALQLDCLREMLQAIDLERLICFTEFPIIFDASNQRITINDESGAKTFTGPTSDYVLDQQRGDLPQDLTVKEISAFWAFIHDLAPFPPDEERDKPRQILPEHLPEMKLEIKEADSQGFMKNILPKERVPVTFDEIKVRLEAALNEAWVYLEIKAAHKCPLNARFQIFEYFWPPDEGTPLAELQHLRLVTADGLCVDDAVARLIQDGCISSVEVVPIRVTEQDTFFRLLCHQGRSSEIFVRSSDEECHPFCFFVGPIVPDDPESCMGEARYNLDEKQFLRYFRGRCADLE